MEERRKMRRGETRRCKIKRETRKRDEETRQNDERTVFEMRRQDEKNKKEKERREEDLRGGLHLHPCSFILPLLFHLCTQAVSTVIAFICPSISHSLFLFSSFFCLWPNTENGRDPKKTSEFIHFSLSLFDTRSQHPPLSHTHNRHTQQALIGWLWVLRAQQAECAGGERCHILLT